MEEVLRTIRDWPVDDPEGLLRFIGEHWRWNDYWAERDGLWVFVTGGWSEHEDMLEALYRSKVWHMLAWYALYLPGGMLIVATSPWAQGWLSRLMRRIQEIVSAKVKGEEDGSDEA